MALSIRSPVHAVCVSALLAATPVHAAPGYSREASRVIASARQAAGGVRAWNQLTGWRETGVLDGGVRYERWLDPLRYGMRLETTEPNGRHIRGFNGQADWHVLPGGQQTGADDRASLSRAKTQAFIDGWLFFYPGRFDATGAYVGVRASEGRVYEVVRVEPYGGAPRELWFDRRTHLLGRIVDRTGPRAITVNVLDYRKVGPILIAHRYEPEPYSPPGTPRRQIDSITFAAADRTLFSLPPPKPKPGPPQVTVGPSLSLPALPTEPPKKRSWLRRS